MGEQGERPLGAVTVEVMSYTHSAMDIPSFDWRDVNVLFVAMST